MPPPQELDPISIPVTRLPVTPSAVTAPPPMESLTQAWLRQNVQPYASSERVYADIDAALARRPTLRPKSDVYTFDDGRTQLLLCVHGLLPIVYRQASYNIPVNVWVPRDYPRAPPIVYVVPTTDMLVRPSRFLDVSGRCSHEYLQNWERKPEGCSLASLLESLQDQFSREPPVYAKPPSITSSQGSPPPVPARPTTSHPQSPASPPPKPPMPAADYRATTGYSPQAVPSSLSSILPQVPPRPPPNIRGFPPALTHPPLPVNFANSATQYSGQPPPPPPPPPPPLAAPFGAQGLAPHPSVQSSAHVRQNPPLPIPNIIDEDNDDALPPRQGLPQSSHGISSPDANPPPRPPNPELLDLHRRVHHKLTSELHSLSKALALDAERLRAHQNDLLAGEPAIRDEMARLEAVRDVCKSVAARTRAAVQTAEGNISELRKKGDPEVDELVCATSIVHNQLINLIAEDNAIEDTIYHLHRGLNTGRLDLERFLRTTRVLAEEQFMKRALINKIQASVNTNVRPEWS